MFLWPWNYQKSAVVPSTLCALLVHENKAPGLNADSKQQNSTESKLPIVVRKQPHRVNSCLLSGIQWCWGCHWAETREKLKAVILICWLLPAEGGHLPGKRRSSVWVAQQDGTTARTSIEQLNLSFKGKSKRAWVSSSILRSVFCSIKCIKSFLVRRLLWYFALKSISTALFSAMSKYCQLWCCCTL